MMVNKQEVRRALHGTFVCLCSKWAQSVVFGVTNETVKQGTI